LRDQWRWEPPAKGAVTQARQRLGPEPVAELFSQVPEPVAGLEADGAFLGPWRLMSVDGTELEAPDTEANRAAFGAGSRNGPYPKVRLVTVCECGSRAPVLAAMDPSVSKGSGGQSLARELYPQLEEGWLLLADRLFYGWADWCAAVLVTTITSWQSAPAPALAAAYHERWQHETAHAQVKTILRGAGRILRSGSPPLAEQEIWGYLLTAWAISALICDAATAAWTGRGRVSFTRAVRIIRRAAGPAFPPSAG
jgi:Insertion element 4 transposase N-terminal